MGCVTIMTSKERFDVIEKRLEAIEGLLYQHDWVKICSSLSGDYTCRKCGRHTTGGLHDGGGYFPERYRYYKMYWEEILNVFEIQVFHYLRYLW